MRFDDDFWPLFTVPRTAEVELSLEDYLGKCSVIRRIMRAQPNAAPCNRRMMVDAARTRVSAVSS